MVDFSYKTGKPASTTVIGIEYGLTIGSIAIALYAWRDFVGLGLLTLLGSRVYWSFFFLRDARTGFRLVGDGSELC